jgi:hypothetical protein
VINNRYLQNAFRDLNKWYFGNKLDPSINVTFASIRPLGRTKNVWVQRPVSPKERRENGLSKEALACYYRPRIFISDKLKFSSRLAVGTLLHEMVHAEDMRQGCGPNWNRFNRRMLKLAKDGAFNGWW